MTEPMRLLYDYTLETSFSANLHTARYRMQKTQVSQLARNLRKALPADTLPVLEDYLSALEYQQMLELEAMFQAAFTLPRALR